MNIRNFLSLGIITVISSCYNPQNVNVIKPVPLATPTLGSPTSDSKEICNDSSVVCENLKKNQNIQAILPDAKNLKTITLKFNEALTISGKALPAQEDACQIPEGNRIEYYHFFVFTEEAGKIKLNGNSAQMPIKTFSCPDTFITSLEFYDLGNIKIPDIKNVPAQTYHDSIFITEGNSYAIKDYTGYVDFATPKINTYIYIEKISKDEITITLSPEIIA